MGTIKNNFNYTDILRAPSQGQLTLLSDENAYNFNPNRYAFYMHFINGLNDPNESLIPSILNIINTSKFTLRQYAEKVTDIMKSLKFAVKKQKNEEEHIKKINILLRSNPLTSGFYIKLRDDKSVSKGTLGAPVGEAGEPVKPGEPERKSDEKPGTPEKPPEKPGTPEEEPEEEPEDEPEDEPEEEPVAPDDKKDKPKKDEPIQIPSRIILTTTHYDGHYIYTGIKYDELKTKATEEVQLTYEALNKETGNSPEIKQDSRITPQLVKEIYEKLKDDNLYGIALNEDTSNLEDPYNVIKYVAKPATGGNSMNNRISLLQLGGEAITYYSQLNKKLNDLEIEPDSTVPSKDKDDRLINISKEDKIREVVKDYEDDPVYGLDTERISPTDRAIFIGLTYIIRAISLFLLNWSINSNMVKNFENAFILYFVSYICIFVIIVVLVNTENNLFFRMLLYYLDSKNNGWGRIMIHILIQLGLMPIIWMLKISSESLKITDFSTSQRLYNVIADYTFFIWLFSSIIALQY